MKEKQKHIEAFEHFYLKLSEGMSVNDTILSVADTFGVSKRTVWRWHEKLDWKNKTALRDIEIQNLLENKTNTTIVDNKATYLGILHFSLNKYVEDVNNKKREPVKIENTLDLERLIRSSLLIQNQPTDISEQTGSVKHEISGKVETENIFTRVDKLVNFIDAGNETEESEEEQDSI